MKITLLQTDIAWAEPKENIRRAAAMMEQAGEADLYVLPEMWATGFATRPEGIAEDEEESVALAWMRQMARERGCAISGSLAVRLNDGTFRNRHYFVTPQATVFYDKRHLFRHGHEDEFFIQGTEAVVAEWQGWRILLQTCYDLRFPCFSRYGRSLPRPLQKEGRTPPVPRPLQKEGRTAAGLYYDAIIYVANWPEKRQLAWDTLVRARAIENQCYVLAVNRTGDTPLNPTKGGKASFSPSGRSGEVYAGGSVIIDPIGRVVTECPAGEHSATAEIFIEKLRDMRSRFRVLDDRD